MKIAGGHRFSSPAGRAHVGGGGGDGPRPDGGVLGEGGGGGGQGSVFGGGHGGGGLGGRTSPVPDSPMSTAEAYSSSGGPGVHVPTGLSGKAARRAAGRVQGLNRRTLRMSLPGSLLPLRPQSKKYVLDFHLLFYSSNCIAK